jgi:hypothetical protein
MSTNDDLARAAAEKCHRYDTENFDCMDEMTRDIADTYAEPMAKLERLRRQVHMVRLCDAYRFNGEYDCWECRICDSYAKGKGKIVHQNDCPHNNEVAT